jgi:hypothetical protein
MLWIGNYLGDGNDHGFLNPLFNLQAVLRATDIVVNWIWIPIGGIAPASPAFRAVQNRRDSDGAGPARYAAPSGGRVDQVERERSLGGRFMTGTSELPPFLRGPLQEI